MRASCERSEGIDENRDDVVYWAGYSVSLKKRTRFRGSGGRNIND